MKLEPLMTIHADLKPPVDHGAGPSGTRLVFDVTGGHFEGARLRGTILPSGGDWLLLDAEGVGTWMFESPWKPTTERAFLFSTTVSS